MSTPYPPSGGGQQGSGPYGAPGPSSWNPGGPSYGAPAGPGYGGYGGPGGTQQGYGAGPGQQAPGQAGSGQYGPGPQGSGQYGPSPYGTSGQGSGGGQYGGPAAQPPQAPRAPKAPRKPVDLGRVLPLALGALGLLGFIFGFLRALTVGNDTLADTVKYSVYQLQGHVPIMVVLVGLFGIAPLLPGGKKYLLPTALLSVATLLAAIAAITSGVSGYGSAGSRGAGLILLLIVALLQTAVAVYVWLTDSGAGKPVGNRSGAVSSSAGSGSPTSASGHASGPRPPSVDRGPGGPAQSRFSGSQSTQAPDSGGYASYQPAAYRPAGAASDTYGSQGPSGRDPAGSQYGPGAGDRAESYGGQPPATHGEATGRPEPVDPSRPVQEPPPDVTQQVRF